MFPRTSPRAGVGKFPTIGAFPRGAHKCQIYLRDGILGRRGVPYRHETSIYSFIHLFIYLFIYLFIIYLFIHLFIYLLFFLLL